MEPLLTLRQKEWYHKSAKQILLQNLQNILSRSRNQGGMIPWENQDFKNEMKKVFKKTSFHLKELFFFSALYIL